MPCDCGKTLREPSVRLRAESVETESENAPRCDTSAKHCRSRRSEASRQLQFLPCSQPVAMLSREKSGKVAAMEFLSVCSALRARGDALRDMQAEPYLLGNRRRHRLLAGRRFCDPGRRTVRIASLRQWRPLVDRLLLIGQRP